MNGYNHPGVGNQNSESRGGQRQVQGQHNPPRYGRQGIHQQNHYLHRPYISSTQNASSSPAYGADIRQRSGQSLRMPSQAYSHENYGHGGGHAQFHNAHSPSNPSLLPAVVPNGTTQLVESNVTPPKKSGGFSLGNLASMANLNEIKGFVDRMGGLDGILATMTKVQKVMGSVSQMAPLVKVFMGSFGKKSAAATADSNPQWRPRRRRRSRSRRNGKPSNITKRRRNSGKQTRRRSTR